MHVLKRMQAFGLPVLQIVYEVLRDAAIPRKTSESASGNGAGRDPGRWGIGSIELDSSSCVYLSMRWQWAEER